MQVIYESRTCSEEYFNKLFETSKKKPGQQVQKYHRLLLQGLVQNQMVVKTITSPPITKEITEQLYIPKQISISKGIEFHHLSVFNLPYIKNIVVIISSFFLTLKMVKNNDFSIIICDVLNISATTGTLLASKFFKKKSKTLGIVTDLPVDLNSKSFVIKYNNFIISLFNGYIFLTEEMNSKLNTKNKEYLVIEGHVDLNMENVQNSLENKSENMICLYAGGLHKKYGIEILVKGFLKANIHKAELHIYGNGDYENDLLEFSKRYHQIKFFGLVPNSVVIAAELRADLLINPRPSNEEYTKYSFPSKNMEYMASGTPILTTKLPGMPEEYFDYIYIIEDESIEGVAKSLHEILGKNKTDLYYKGIKSKSFVMEEKNNVIQARKILNLAKKIFDNQ